jgi:N-acetyl-anhydromuramyl-L-alanine amidase AmpD
MRHINEIIIHTTATRPEWMAVHGTLAKVQEIARWHVRDRGWRAIGYHYIIDRDGTVANGRPLEQVGAHVKGHNANSIGIALLGGFGGAADDMFADHYTPAQDKALRKLIADLQTRFPEIGKVTGHSTYARKSCPCFIVGEWLRATSATEIGKPGLWAAIVALFKKWIKK